jgi:formate dehydrogenase
MQILALVRNVLASHDWITNGGWNIADSVERAYDLEGMDVGVLAAGRIGVAVLRRLAPFDVRLHYSQRRRLPPDVERELALKFHPNALFLAEAVDVLSIHSPLVPETYHLFDDKLLGSMKRGSYIVNTAPRRPIPRAPRSRPRPGTRRAPARSWRTPSPDDRSDRNT